MGLEKGKDTFLMVVRAALWDEPEKAGITLIIPETTCGYSV